MLNGVKLRELYYRVMAEASKPMPQADMMYLMGETGSNQVSVLDRASEFSGPIGIIGYPEEHFGYPGSSVWVPELAKRGVSAERIVLINTLTQMDGRTISHTLSEMWAVVRYAKLNKLRKIIIVAPRFHILRSFMSGVHALLSCFPELQLYPVTGTPLDWDEESSHSQGMLMGIRADFMIEEIIRIYTYHTQGNLPDPEAVLVYLDRRDAA